MRGGAGTDQAEGVSGVLVCEGCGSEIAEDEEYGEYRGRLYCEGCVQEFADDGNELGGSL